MRRLDVDRLRHFDVREREPPCPLGRGADERRQEISRRALAGPKRWNAELPQDGAACDRCVEGPPERGHRLPGLVVVRALQRAERDLRDLPRKKAVTIVVLSNRLAALNLDTSRPGFYDDPSFIAAEARDPRLLEAYAAHVDGLQHDEGYVRYARARVRETTAFLVDRLWADPRRGACVDVSLVLGRFLERQGVWNYGVRGAVAISFPPKSRLAPYHMRRYGDVPGHVWLRAPPFRIVDLTIALQDYSNGEERHLQKYIIEENVRAEAPRVSDLLDDADRLALRSSLGREPRVTDVSTFATKAWTVRRAEVEIRYTPNGVTALDGTLEAARNLQFSGKYPGELWSDFHREKSPPTGYASS